MSSGGLLFPHASTRAQCVLQRDPYIAYVTVACCQKKEKLVDPLLLAIVFWQHPTLLLALVNLISLIRIKLSRETIRYPLVLKAGLTHQLTVSVVSVVQGAIFELPWTAKAPTMILFLSRWVWRSDLLLLREVLAHKTRTLLFFPNHITANIICG